LFATSAQGVQAAAKAIPRQAGISVLKRGRCTTMTLQQIKPGTALMIAMVALLGGTTAASAEKSFVGPALNDTQKRVVRGEPEWIKVGSRIVEPQLLKAKFNLAKLPGRFKAFRLLAGHGTVEIARVTATFKQDRPLVDNRFAILKSDSSEHRISFKGSERYVRNVEVVSSIPRRHRRNALISLYGLQVVDIPIPPLPVKISRPDLQSAASASAR